MPRDTRQRRRDGQRRRCRGGHGMMGQGEGEKRPPQGVVQDPNMISCCLLESLLYDNILVKEESDVIRDNLTAVQYLTAVPSFLSLR